MQVILLAGPLNHYNLDVTAKIWPHRRIIQRNLFSNVTSLTEHIKALLSESNNQEFIIVEGCKALAECLARANIDFEIVVEADEPNAQRLRNQNVPEAVINDRLWLQAESKKRSVKLQEIWRQHYLLRSQTLPGSFQRTTHDLARKQRKIRQDKVRIGQTLSAGFFLHVETKLQPENEVVTLGIKQILVKLRELQLQEHYNAYELFVRYLALKFSRGAKKPFKKTRHKLEKLAKAISVFGLCEEDVLLWLK